MAVLQGRVESEAALKHRGMSITLVNKQLMSGDTSDTPLAGVALLAGYEVSGYPPALPYTVPHDLHELGL